jgi:hypothetical protein
VQHILYIISFKYRNVISIPHAHTKIHTHTQTYTLEHIQTLFITCGPNVFKCTYIFSKKAHVLHMYFANWTRHGVNALYNGLEYHKGAIGEVKQKNLCSKRKESKYFKKRYYINVIWNQVWKLLFFATVMKMMQATKMCLITDFFMLCSPMKYVFFLRNTTLTQS